MVDFGKEVYNIHMDFMPTPHYYGDIVRKLFIAAGVILIFTILVDKELLPFNIYFGIVGLLIIVGLAGFTNPKSKMSVIFDAVFSSLMFLTFEFFAVSKYVESYSYFEPVFVFRQLVALIFLVAFYFSIKSIRGMIIR